MATDSGKAPYEAPVLTVQGTFEAITHGNLTGTRFDGNFVIGQPAPNPLNIFS